MFWTYVKAILMAKLIGFGISLAIGFAVLAVALIVLTVASIKKGR